MRAKPQVCMYTARLWQSANRLDMPNRCLSHMRN